MTRRFRGRGHRVAATLILAVLTLGLGKSTCVAADDIPISRPSTNLQVALWDTGVPGQAQALAELVFSFQRNNPDVVVALEWRDAGLADEWLRRWCDGYRSHAPDVTVASDLWTYRNRDELMPLPADLAQVLRGDLEPAMLERAGGIPRGVPWAVSTPALYYRADLLRRENLTPPATLAELAEAAATLASPPDRFGLGVPGPGGGGEELLYVLALALAPEEGDAMAHEGASAMEPRLQRALELLVQMQARGALEPEVLTWSEQELVREFTKGRLGMIIAPPWAARVLRDSAGMSGRAQEGGVAPIEWAVQALPVAPGGAGQVAADWLIAFADTDRPDPALRFLRFMAERESQRTLSMLCGAPALRSIAAELASVQPWSAHSAALDYGSGLPLRDWDDLRPRLSDALFWALSGRLSPAESLEQSD